MSTCPVCEGPATVKDLQTLGDYDEVVCPSCGKYEISRSARAEFGSGEFPFEDRRRMLEAAKGEAALGRVPRISSYLH